VSERNSKPWFWIATPPPATTTPVFEPDEPKPVVGGGLKSLLSSACVAAGAYQLWFILLALFMLLVGVVAFVEPPLANRMPAIPLVAILVPLVLLLLFWYLTPACRIASWIPLVLILAAGIGIFTAFRDKELASSGNVIELPAGEKKAPAPLPTPPAWPTKRSGDEQSS